MKIEDFMKYVLQPGNTIVLTGEKNSGKTATAVSIAQHAIMGDYCKNTEVITNITFGKVSDGSIVESYPAHVHHEDTLSGTFYRVGNILKEYGDDILILWILDDAHNFDVDQKILRRYFDNSQRFKICNIFATSSNDFGNCTFQFAKDVKKASSIWRDPKNIVFVTGASKKTIFIEPTSWARDPYTIRDGYGYCCSSIFAVGEFDFNNFLIETSKGLPHEISFRILQFFGGE